MSKNTLQTDGHQEARIPFDILDEGMRTLVAGVSQLHLPDAVAYDLEPTPLELAVLEACDRSAQEDGYIMQYDAYLPFTDGGMDRDGQIQVGETTKHSERRIATSLVQRLGTLLHELGHGYMVFGPGGPKARTYQERNFGHEERIVESAAYLVLYYFGTEYYPAYSVIQREGDEDSLVVLAENGELIYKMAAHFIHRIESQLARPTQRGS